MEKFILRFLIIIATLASMACGKVVEPEAGIDNYVYVSGSFSQQDSAGLAGSGIVRFVSTMPSINASKSVELTGELYNTGSITAIFFSDSPNLPNNRGVQIKLLRTAGAITTGFVSVNGTNVGIQDNRLSYISPGAFSLVLEVHNTPSNSRVIIWKKDSVSYSLANVEVDTANNSHLTGNYPLGGGTGVYSGLQLLDGKLTSAALSNAKVIIP